MKGMGLCAGTRRGDVRVLAQSPLRAIDGAGQQA
jgi:hypothetical protein